MSNKQVLRRSQNGYSPEPIYTYDSDQGIISETGPRNVVRYPIKYSRPCGSDVNHERLPPNQNMQGMELAYRESPMGEKQVVDFATSWHFSLFLLLTTFSIALGAGLPYTRPIVITFGLPLFAAIGFFYVFAMAARNKLTIQKLVVCLTLPSLVGATITALFYLFKFRLFSGTVLSIITAAVTFGFALHVLRFFDEWVLTAPNLKPSTRSELRKSPNSYHFDMAFPLASLVIATFVPLVSVSLAILLVLVCLSIPVFTHFYYSGFKGVLRFQNQTALILGQYLLYGKVTTGAPGVWRPRIDTKKRLTLLFAAAVLPTMAFAIALEGFCPWDLPLVWNEMFTGESKTVAETVPHGWVLVAVHGLSQGTLAYIWCFSISIFLSVIIPTLFIASVFLRPTRLAMQRRKRIERETDLDDGRTEWQWYVDRVRSSRHSDKDPILGRVFQERDHLFLGVEPSADHPVLLDTSILSEHLYITGESGSGKTSLGIMPLLIQLIRKNSDGTPLSESEAKEQRKPHTTLACPNCNSKLRMALRYKHATANCPKCNCEIEVQEELQRARKKHESELPPPMVIIDLKGDPGLFHTVRAEAEARQPGSFRWFTPEAGFASHYFNPFLSMNTDGRSFVQVCELLLESLGLSHGEGYGRSYFTRQNRMAILDALRSEPAPRSFEELNEAVILLARRNSQDYENIGELVSTLRTLCEYEQLSMFKPLKKPEQAIHMPSVLENRQVVYFWLPAALESVSVREIAKLALYSYLSAAIDRQRKGMPVRTSYLLIDEFQRIVSENFKVILEQARSFGVGVILANQTAADLVTPSADLRATVNVNTRAKIMFSISDPFEMKTLQSLSGEEIAESKSYQMPDMDQSNTAMSTIGTVQEFIKPRMTASDILAVNDHPLDFFFQVSRGSGYTQYGGLPLRIRATWPIPFELYKQRFENEAWPEFEEYELEEGEGLKGSESPDDLERKRNAWSQEFNDMLRDIHESYEYGRNGKPESSTA